MPLRLSGFWFMQEFINTPYGVKRMGHTRFVFVATHGAGDDRHTNRLVRLLSREMDAYGVINKFFTKKTHSKAHINPDNVEDFNRLSWSHRYKRYIWTRRKPELKIFYKDVADICDGIEARGEKAVVIHIHGMDHDTLGIDLGAGVRFNDRKKKFLTNTPGHIYTGKLTMPRKDLLEFKNLLDKELKQEFNLEVGIGEVYPAYSKRMGIQFHKHRGRDDIAVQVEINKKIKDTPELRKKIVKILSKTLSIIY